MRTLLVAVVGVTGVVVAGCGGKADFTPLWSLSAAGASGSDAPTGGADGWDGGSSVGATGQGAASGGRMPSGGASSTSPRDTGSTSPPAQGGRPPLVGTGGAIGVAGGANVGGHAAAGGSVAVGGRVSTGGSRPVGGTVAVGGTGGSSRTSAGGTVAVGGSVAFGGRGAVGGREAVGGTVAVGGASPVGGTAGVGGPVLADGGGPIAGTGGTVTIDPPPIPAGCRVIGDTVSDYSYCQLNLVCDNDYVSTYCSADYQGGWYCDCYSSKQYLNYSVKGADAAEACAAVSQLCSAEDPLALMGPETCVADDPSPQSYDCQLQCKRTAELRGGVSVALSTSTYAYCFEQNGRQRCECYNDMSSRTFDISGVDGDSSCRLALDLCDPDPSIVFDGPTECETGYAYSYSGYCELQQDCWQSAAVRENVTALQYDSRYSSCYDDNPSGTTCSCYGNQWSMAFQLPGRQANDGACSDAQAICAQPEGIVLSGDPECERVAQSVDPNYCDAQIVCTQSARWGDTDLTMNPWLWLTCQPETSGAWLCMCSAGMQTVNFEVGAAQGWDVCTEAAERCPDLIDVTSLTSGTGWIGPA
ncbi:MAG: hypothetical protein JW940_03180 [Polyangiaceae bacterium]|nr:hypothetical protein [Polyangiaceae bacterium]